MAEIVKNYDWNADTAPEFDAVLGELLAEVDADPTADIRNLKKIRMVILNGEIVDRAAIMKRHQE